MRPKEPWIAALLAFFLPFAGFLYLAKWVRCVVYALVYGAALFLGNVAAFDGYWGHPVRSFPPLLIVQLVAAFDAYQTTVRSLAAPAHIPWITRLPVVLVLVGTIVAASIVINRYWVSAYSIASVSMAPTLMHGDIALIEKYFWRSRPMQRGDLIIFTKPDDQAEVNVKRIIGLPGDVIYYKNQALYLNGASVPRREIPTPAPSPDMPEWMVSKRVVETLDGREYQLLINDDQLGFDGEISVPPDSYFVLGDNRNYSYDSREWGMVSKQDIIGKPFVIWASTKGNRRLKFHWNRMGRLLN